MSSMAGIIQESFYEEREVTVKQLKLSTSDLFKEEPGKIKDFLIQLKLYMRFNRGSFPDDQERILYALSFMRDKAVR